MRFGIVVTIPYPAVDLAVNPYLYGEAMSSRGHAVELLGPEGSEFVGRLPHRVVREGQWSDPEFWRSCAFDVAWVFTWMTRSAVVESIVAAGTVVLSRGDSDGFHGVRVYPWETLMRWFFWADTRLGKARAVWHWLKRYAYLHYAEDREIIRTLILADATILDTESARRHFNRFLSFHRLSEYSGLVHVVPHLVANTVTHVPLAEKKNKVVAVGRWYDPQKDVGLLIRTLERFLIAHRDVEIVIIGRYPPKTFEQFLKRHPDVRILGVLPHAKMVEELRGARICLMTSRWESFHIAAHEALCLGATVVGPEVIPLPDICAAGPFGAMVKSRCSGKLASALSEELNHWEAGKRQPASIARFWRDRVAADRVAERLEEIGLRASIHRKHAVDMENALRMSASQTG